MSQIRDKKERKKGIETKNPINAKSDTPSFACYLVCIYLSESFDFLKINTLYSSATCVNVLQISCKPENKHP